MKKATILTRKQLYERVWSKSISALAVKYGITTNALSKICDRLDVPYPSRGYWSKLQAGKAPQPVPLPPDPSGKDEKITISSERSSSRRPQTRLTQEARREQLIEVAAAILVQHGPHAASMKRIAKAAGISEAHTYNYFRSHEDLLIEVARRELRAMRTGRQAAIEQGQDHYSRLALSTRDYLHQAAERGALLQLLVENAQVRSMLRQDYRARRAKERNRHADRLVEMFGVPRAVALACTVILTGVSMRTGKLVANKKISAEVAERLCVAMIIQGSRDTISAAKAPSGAAVSPRQGA